MLLIASIYHYMAMLIRNDILHRLFLKNFLSFFAALFLLGVDKSQ